MAAWTGRRNKAGRRPRPSREPGSASGSRPTNRCQAGSLTRTSRILNAFSATDAPGLTVPLFREPDFRRLWLVGLIVFAVRWLETLVVAVVVYQRTGSAFLVAMMTMLRLLPMGLFGAFLGAAAERWERRTSLLLVLLSLLLSSLVLALLAYAGRLEVWHLAVVSFWNGVGWATDNPVRRMMIGEVAGAVRMGRAMSFDIGANNASRMIGPIFGGLLLVSGGVTGAFALAAMDALRRRVGGGLRTAAAQPARQRRHLGREAAGPGDGGAACRVP